MAERKANLEGMIPATLKAPGAARFWLAVVATGIGAGLGAAALTSILYAVQHAIWPPAHADMLNAAAKAPAWRHLIMLSGAGVVTGIGQILLINLTSGNAIEITTAIWFTAGRLPLLRTVGSAILSILIVGMGASLGREGAPKQIGAAVADQLSNRSALSDEQRRLLVACGAGAGMAAAYDVPLGGALFALEVLRGVFALRLLLPALCCALVATVVSWIALPNRPTYSIPDGSGTASVIAFAVFAGPVAGLLSALYVRMIAWADRNRPKGLLRLGAPLLVFGFLGVASIPFPQLLGNGKDLAQLTFDGALLPSLLIALLFLKPLATVICLASGAPGGLFTPSLTFGALLGGALGRVWTWIWPGVPGGLFAVVGAGAVLAATTQGPISAIVLMMELTGHDRAFLAPLVIAVVTATLVARTIDARSIYDARLTDDQLSERQKLREPSPD